MIAAIFVAGLPGIVQGQGYPTRTVRVVVAFTAGGTTDILARSISKQPTQRLRQPFLIDNRPGAGGNIGTELVVQSAPDGYTLIVDSVGPIAVNPTLFKGLSYNPVTELVPIVQIADVPNVLVVHPSLGVTNFEELITYAKANPGKLNFGSTGIGTSSHLSGYMFCRRAVSPRPISATRAPKPSTTFSPAACSSCSRPFHRSFSTFKPANRYRRGEQPEAVPLVAGSSDRQRARRSKFRAGSWFGLFAPKGTPESVIRQLNSTVNEILAMPSIEKQMVCEGADPVGGTTAAFRQLVQERVRTVEADRPGVGRDAGLSVSFL